MFSRQDIIQEDNNLDKSLHFCKHLKEKSQERADWTR